jgi:predicted NUDIX family NTP pyrophosphohydrolase
MMARQSAGILLYRLNNKNLEVFLVHPGGPFWKNKDEGAWSIPKGEFGDKEDALDAAIREMEEETGYRIEDKCTPLSTVKQKSGKIIHAWACRGDVDPAKIRSNEFEMEWPPRSGKKTKFPEVDKAAWFDSDTAKKKINPGQVNLITELESKIG